MIDQIEWLGHGTFILHGSPVNASAATAERSPSHPLIYINPWRIARVEHPADVILLTSDRFDRCSPPDLRKLCAPHTQIIAAERALPLVEGCNVTVLRPWQSLSLDLLCVKAIPAYYPAKNVDQGLGFVISMQYYDIYYAGDTGLIPEMSRLHPDIALLPIDGHDTMTPEEAARAAIEMGSRWVIPFNWGAGANNASRIDAISLMRDLNGKAETVLLNPSR